jgi:hypothetical protein
MVLASSAEDPNPTTPLGAVVHHSKFRCLTSALGQKQTSGHVQSMSALPPKADIGTHSWNVRFVPKADIDISLRWPTKGRSSIPFLRQFFPDSL